uniref:NACHT domain-containing protein n=1 Tax=Tetraodon nigroviridis TaxID=99883 RepID=H3D222_TETNG
RCGKNAHKAQDKELIFTGDTHRQKSLLGLNQVYQVFEGSHGNNPKRYILLLGNAGMGKSTLIKKLCLDWSKDRFPQFDFVFLLDGKLLTLTKPNFSLQTLLLNFSSFSIACSEPDAVYAQITAAPKRVLIIFDGFAEIRDFEALLQPQDKDLTASLQKDSKTQTYTIKQLYAGILQKVLLLGSTLLLAARPRGAASQVLRRTDSYLDICGFSLSDVETYVSRYFTEPSLRESALESLKVCSYLHLLCWNPGLCRLVCSVLSKNLGELPRTLTELCRVRESVYAPTATPSSDDQTTSSSSSEKQVHHVEVQPKRSRSAEIEEKEEEKEKAEEGTGGGKEAEAFLSQSYLAALHLSLSRNVSHRTFFQSLPLLSGQKLRRRSQREELELTQRFALRILKEKLEMPDVDAKASVRDMFVSKWTSVAKHLEDLSHGNLSPAQLLEACHYVYEASFIHSNPSESRSGAALKGDLVAKLPEVLVFRGVPLNPSDAYVVQHILERAGQEGASFCLDLEDSGIQISGLKSLVSLSNINTYRACIADVITLWEQLEQSGEEELRQKAMCKFKIHPLKASQVCHIEHLAKLVNVHLQKSTSQSDPILAEGVPAVAELRKLEFELGPEKGLKALPKLWELLPGLHNLQHLDLENSNIGDKGAEKLADALVSLVLLEILNLSQNCIGDEGMKKLATTLRDLPKLHCLSLYCNMISDEGAKSLAAVLPHMASLTDLDVKYNKLTDVGAQSLGDSLTRCKNIRTLRMWNECIPYGVFERLREQDSRILWH